MRSSSSSSRRGGSASALAAVVLLAAAALLVPSAAAFDADVEAPAVLIVEYAGEAVTAAMASSSSAVTIAASQAAGAAAAAAAEERGASLARRQAIAEIAAESAVAAPAVAALTSRVTLAAMGSGVNITGLTNYQTVLRGAAIKTGSHADATALKAQLQENPAIKAVWFAGTKELVKPVVKPGKKQHTKQRATTSAHVQGALVASTLPTGVSATRKTFPGLDGSGVLLCIVDTGINYAQPLYGQCAAVGYPKQQCSVVTGFNFVGNGYIGTREGPAAVPGAPPTDCMGHGSMVASVAGTQHGVAPGVMLGSYRVFGCSGYAGDNVLVEAIDRAVRDGCDIINLSLASGSGYEDNDMYQRVMANAIKKGVLVVKAAGNSGTEGPFRADVSTAVGAITVASVDVVAKHGGRVYMSPFSSFGPNPNLDLLPHVSAPGGDVPVVSMDGQPDAASGTSFSSPYTAGVLALWLQQKQAAASDAGVPLDRESISHDAALRGLVVTAKGVKDKTNANFNEPVAWMGAGMLQAEAFLTNRARISPLMLQLPSGLQGRQAETFEVSWDGPPTPSGRVTYRLTHEPSAAITLSDGWYGTKAAIKKEYVAADLLFSTQEVTLDTTRGRGAPVKVTFSLPEGLAGQPLLYSGLIKLTPVEPQAGAAGVWPLTLPYQGYAAPLSSMRLAARPLQGVNLQAATALRAQANALCYSPGAVPSFLNEVMDHLAVVPQICSGGLATEPNSLLRVSLQTLRRSPECSLRVTLAAEVPLKQMTLLLLDDGGHELGYLEPLDTTAGGGLAKMAQVMSYCTRFDGSYRNMAGQVTMVVPGQVYRLRALLQGPVTTVDAAHGMEPRVDQIAITGRFLIVAATTARADTEVAAASVAQPAAAAGVGAAAPAVEEQPIGATVDAAGLKGLVSALAAALT